MTPQMLPESKDLAAYAIVCQDALCRGMVRRTCQCDKCGRKWETEYERKPGVQRGVFTCDCGHRVVDIFTR